MRSRWVLQKSKTVMNRIKDVPIMTYGPKTWTMGKRYKITTQSHDLTFLRSSKGFLLGDSIRNGEIRRTIEEESLQ